ncbi:hypothetical protein Noc_1243 [Nitrosococcus oceani ATCC 19707]|uniref:Uncharacterized protein n=2 Tax=Nitrosococcus oceani TaxID=1229 RepID=Q3JBQ2_NITOC|nr:hypothetical protein [Nitrosococcus oceani]ABA57744.1 hypothetical protein Noc_1243 [Nitrosococcus oceani ATCC 19707]KFI19832.1 hypothetical protein IB75_06490 [Nitrosococcus oceani C-27]GEM19399.1 hypothetical protein NONS58_07840 [Nitrosococcus oceani]
MADNLSGQERYRHETTDVQNYTIVWLGLVILLAIVLGGFFVFGLIHLYENNQQEIESTPPKKEDIMERVPSAPYLEASSGAGLAELQEKNEDLLHSYGWVDKKRGIFHIPIKYAMELLVEKNSQTQEDMAHSKKQVSHP